MTTVINYNFFGPDTDSIFGDLGLKNRSSNKKRNHSPKEERTIDITAQSRVLDEDDNNIERDSRKHSMAARLANPSEVSTTYDRQGKIVQHFNSTGMHVNCKV
jgi:hypothetical protein